MSSPTLDAWAATVAEDDQNLAMGQRLGGGYHLAGSGEKGCGGLCGADGITPVLFVTSTGPDAPRGT